MKSNSRGFGVDRGIGKVPPPKGRPAWLICIKWSCGFPELLCRWWERSQAYSRDRCRLHRSRGNDRGHCRELHCVESGHEDGNDHHWTPIGNATSISTSIAQIDRILAIRGRRNGAALRQTAQRYPGAGSQSYPSPAAAANPDGQVNGGRDPKMIILNPSEATPAFQRGRRV
jgi:hypothetical protein